jgi:hypothetical protein
MDRRDLCVTCARFRSCEHALLRTFELELSHNATSAELRAIDVAGMQDDPQDLQCDSLDPSLLDVHFTQIFDGDACASCVEIFSRSPY